MKKMLKIIGIVLLCIVGVVAALLVKNYIDSQRPWLKEDYYLDFHSDAPLEQKYAGPGDCEVKNTVYKSDDKAIGNIRVWYPAELEESEKQYPMILVVNASNMAALNYKPFFNRLASWGFIVVGNDDRQAGTGVTASKTLDFVLNLKDSVLSGKIDETAIGCVGYSQGGAGAINAVTRFENSGKFTALFTGSAAYALLSTSMGWGYDISKVTIPYFMTAGTGKSDDTGVADINAEFGGVAPLASLIQNYEEICDDVFKVRARVTGAEHQEMQMKTDAYMTVWMLYHLQGDAEAESVFLGEGAELLGNTNWQDVEKNK